MMVSFVSGVSWNVAAVSLGFSFVHLKADIIVCRTVTLTVSLVRINSARVNCFYSWLQSHRALYLNRLNFHHIDVRWMLPLHRVDISHQVDSVQWWGGLRLRLDYRQV